MARPDPCEAVPGVAEVVREFVRRLAPAQPAQMRDDDEFVRDLGYDSLAMLELQFVLEELFGFEPIDPEEILDVWTIADLIRLAGSLLAAGLGTVPSESVIDAMRAQHQGSQKA
jgi:acyl carrier protein